MKIENYEAMDVTVTRNEVIKIVADYIMLRHGKMDGWKVVDNYGNIGDITLIIQRDIGSIDTESK